ncbi:MAG: O-antigen ligase family protein [Bacteroidetes bacterium]|nr:O-antigen ligase family protein [Bacteroidota bacterium]MBT3801738.1 O-antigen ligase family protein [Bacteroidota bacterium]MBT5989643.1 O-antigen ligase family protein [Bacteroidota bacterium]MBT7824958.1 O-antigen ligase family protein [Bacteroidota bacterium]
MNTKSLIKDNIGFAGIILFLFGLLFSPFILSISLLPLLIQPFLLHSPKEIFQKLFQDKVSILLLLYFMLIILGIFYTSNLNLFWKDLQLKLPFLLLPIAFIYPNYYSKKSIFRILSIFIVLTFFAGLLSFINYLIHYDEINRLIFKAKPTPIIANINHIYYSFILAFAIISGLFLHKYFFNRKYLRIINYSLLFFNLVFIHTIAARTGLFALYGCGFVLLIYYGFKNSKIVLTLFSLVLIVSIGIASVKYIPVLNNRYQKSVEDINTFRNGGDINHYSISMRLVYWQKSFQVFLKSPVIGVGLADVKAEMREIFDAEKSSLVMVNRRGPHNQFLEILAGMGLVGFVLFLYLLISAYKVGIKQNSAILVAFLTIMIFTFLAESTLERQAGIGFFTFMLLLLSKPEVAEESK